MAANYVIEGHDKVSFNVGNYDVQRALVIDPILSYSTYLGGSNIDGANAIAVAPDNTAFIAGGTFSTDFPTAGTHPLQPNHGGPDDFSKDAFVAKLSVDGSTVLYATYLGGAEQDEAHGIAVDNFGNAYVTGTTLSADFPTTPGTFGTICGADAKCGASFNPGGLVVSNGFLAKLNPAGSALIYSEYIGYYEDVECLAVAVDSDQNAYITGQTSANIVPTVVITPLNTPPPPFPITASAFQQTFAGGATDAFVMKISASGLSILYSSYLGGSDEDDALGIAVDGSHSALSDRTYLFDGLSVKESCSGSKRRRRRRLRSQGQHRCNRCGITAFLFLYWVELGLIKAMASLSIAQATHMSLAPPIPRASQLLASYKRRTPA